MPYSSVDVSAADHEGGSGQTSCYRALLSELLDARRKIWEREQLILEW